MFTLKPIALMLACAVNLLACGTVSVKEEVSEAITAPSEAPQPPSVRQAPIRQVLVDRLLNKANAALERGRLGSPAHDNAYDHFRAVLQFDPQNAQALSGLDAVLLAYCDLAREHMKSDPGTAALYLQQAEALYPESSLLVDLRRDLRQLRQQRSERMQVREEPGDKVDLPAHWLKARDEQIKSLLSSVAERVKQHNERVIIYARNDEEGRWIYQTMKSFAGDYRIRGDIRINPVSYLILLEALPL